MAGSAKNTSNRFAYDDIATSRVRFWLLECSCLFGKLSTNQPFPIIRVCYFCNPHPSFLKYSERSSTYADTFLDSFTINNTVYKSVKVVKFDQLSQVFLLHSSLQFSFTNLYVALHLESAILQYECFLLQSKVWNYHYHIYSQFATRARSYVTDYFSWRRAKSEGRKRVFWLLYIIPN
jgi:hypothetical protein